MELNQIIQGDCIKVVQSLPPDTIQTVITSPPYWGLRDYGMTEQIGLEETVQEYIQKIVSLFREIKRVLKDDGTVWLNLGDAYAGSGRGRISNGQAHPGIEHKQSVGQRSGVINLSNKIAGLKPKDLIGLPWRVAFALQEDGWYLRKDIVWNKPNAMPESVRDRPTSSHEYIFLLSKSQKYYYDHEAIKEEAAYKPFPDPPRGSRGAFGKEQQGRREDKPRGSFKGKYGDLAFRAIRNKRNKRSVWTVATKPTKDAHFATYPVELIEPCVLAGCPVDGIILDPFMGSGTTGIAALKHSRNFIGIELNPEYIKIANKRLNGVQIELLHHL